MAFIQYLNFDGEDLPLPDSYEMELKDVEAENTQAAGHGYSRAGGGAEGKKPKCVPAYRF